MLDSIQIQQSSAVFSTLQMQMEVGSNALYHVLGTALLLGKKDVAAWEENIGTEGIGRKKFHSLWSC